MADRVPSKRAMMTRGKDRRGGPRPGSGRRFGSVTEVKRIARAKAAQVDKLPHELLLEWALTGRMRYPNRKGQYNGGYTELEPADRISCAKGCAAWYKPAMQPRVAPGEQPPVLRLELDEKMIAAFAAKSPDKLDMLRDVLRAIQAGGADVSQAAGTGQADPSRYGKLLTETSDVAGQA